MTSPEQFISGQILLINKPKGWTSHDVVNKIRRRLSKFCNQKIKTGHAGTLDPLATGLLLIATGKFTKKLHELQYADKEYIGTFYLGAVTASYDAETPVDTVFELKNITSEKIYEAAKHFTGEQQQIPPAYSAIKKDGERAYKKIRKGEEVILQPRKICIYDFEITNIILPEINFKVKCSKGTYIRSLANDFGKYLNGGAYLKNLCRTQIGNYNLADAKKIDEFLDELKYESI